MANEISSLELFRFRNNLLKKDIAEYLGVSPAFVGQVCRGASRLPADKLEALVCNDRGWDTSALRHEPSCAKTETIEDILRDIRNELREVSKSLQALHES